MAHVAVRMSGLPPLRQVEAEAVVGVTEKGASTSEERCARCGQTRRYHDDNGLCGLDPGPPYDDRAHADCE